MMNSTRMIYFNNLLMFMKFRTISNDIYYFNEDSFNIANFYSKDWDNFDQQIDVETSLLVGVRIQNILQYQNY